MYYTDEVRRFWYIGKVIFHSKFLECIGARAIKAGYLMKQGGGGGRHAIKAGYMMEHLNPGESEHIMLSSTLLCQSSCMICEIV